MVDRAEVYDWGAEQGFPQEEKGDTRVVSTKVEAYKAMASSPEFKSMLGEDGIDNDFAQIVITTAIDGLQNEGWTTEKAWGYTIGRLQEGWNEGRDSLLPPEIQEEILRYKALLRDIEQIDEDPQATTHSVTSEAAMNLVNSAIGLLRDGWGVGLTKAFFDFELEQITPELGMYD